MDNKIGLEGLADPSHLAPVEANGLIFEAYEPAKMAPQSSAARASR